MTPEEMGALEVRVGAGIEWLSSHDPGGRFYAWWQVGLTPSSKMPGQSDETIAAWGEWYKAKLVYDKLEKQLARAEERGFRSLTWPLPWVPAKDVRP